jgi:hypothetical protein
LQPFLLRQYRDGPLGRPLLPLHRHRLGPPAVARQEVEAVPLPHGDGRVDEAFAVVLVDEQHHDLDLLEAGELVDNALERLVRLDLSRDLQGARDADAWKRWRKRLR